MTEIESRLAGLTEEEYQLYLVHEKHGDGVSGLYLTIAKLRASDARKLALLKKHQYQYSRDSYDNSMHCVSCFASINVPPEALSHKYYTDKIVCQPDCAIAAELEGGE